MKNDLTLQSQTQLQKSASFYTNSGISVIKLSGEMEQNKPVLQHTLSQL